MTPSAPSPIILDCDPGHDDAVAILLAAGDPRIELVGITTVAGNQTLDRTTRNACVVCTVGGIDVPVVAGCDRPLLRPLQTAPHIHGTTGLDGPPPIEPSVTPAAGHAIDFIRAAVAARPGEITLVAVGPLTNLALAVRADPRLVTAVRQVVIMGGTFGRGNVTPTGEFNMVVDPEAAAIVVGAGWPITMVGLDLTHQARCTTAVVDGLVSVGTPAAVFVGQLMDAYRNAYRRSEGLEDPPVHDPCAVAYVADPDLVEVLPAAVAVETQGILTAGTTVVDFASPSPTQAVGTRLDVDGLWGSVTDALRALG